MAPILYTTESVGLWWQTYSHRSSVVASRRPSGRLFNALWSRSLENERPNKSRDWKGPVSQATSYSASKTLL